MAISEIKCQREKKVVDPFKAYLFDLDMTWMVDRVYAPALLHPGENGFILICSEMWKVKQDGKTIDPCCLTQSRYHLNWYYQNYNYTVIENLYLLQS